MSLQFIYGNSGSGKTSYLYKKIVEEALLHPTKNYLMVVPEQFTMQTQKNLCHAHPNGGIMNIDVLSFDRLAYRVFEEVGKDKRTVLDDEGKRLILRKLASKNEKEYTVLKGNLKKPGYISELNSILSEFMQYDILPEQIETVLKDIPSESYLYYKLKDLRHLYQSFNDYLEDTYITKQEVLDLLNHAVSKSELLKNSVIAFDCFTGFTPVQVRVLISLMKYADKIMITVEMDAEEEAYYHDHSYHMFSLSEHMIDSLLKAAAENEIIVEKPINLCKSPSARYLICPELAFLEKEIFRYHRGHYDSELSGHISMHEAKNPKEEAFAIASNIKKLVREKNMRYRDFAVITSDMETYADSFEKAFASYEIPVFIDHTKNIMLNAFVEYLRSLLLMIDQNYTYESVFRFLRTGFCSFTSDQLDEMENYCRALDIKGYKNWSKLWARVTKSTNKKDLDRLNRYREQFVTMMNPLRAVLKKSKKTVLDITTALYQFLVDNHLQEKVKELEEYFVNSNEHVLAKEYAQIYHIVMDLFDKMVELLGDEPITIKEYMELVDAGLTDSKVGVIPPTVDQVLVGDIERTRVQDIKVLFFAGANDSLLPGFKNSRGLLTERERDLLEDNSIKLAPGPKEKIYIQKFYLYMTLTKPSDSLHIFWSKTSNNGKALRPAYLVHELKRLYPKLTVIDEEHVVQELMLNEGLTLLANGLRDHQFTGEWKELFSYINKNDKEEVQKLLDAGFFKKEEPMIGEDLSDKIYSDKSKVSITRMERFSACPYAHFLDYGLHLQEREEHTFKPMDLGNIAHQSLERFSNKAREKHMDWKDFSDEQRETMVDECVEESVLDYGNTVLYSSARNEYMIRRIKHLINRSVWALTKQMEVGDFKLSGCEFNFGSGKIDRIDTCETENTVYVKVTDYKTGMKSFDITAFYHGLQLQLPVYLNAALEQEKKRHPGKEVVPAGIFYYRIQDPFIGKKTEDADAAILSELKLDGLVNANEDVIEHLEHNLEGASSCYPLRKNKDGSLGSASKAVSSEGMEEMLDYTKKKEKEIKDAIYNGSVEPAPYRMGDCTGCDYCKYHNICGFDQRLNGYSYKEMKKYTSDEVFEKMKEN